MRGEVPIKWSKNRRGWHLDKTISISHILSVLGIAVALMIKLDEIEDSAQQNKTAIEQLKKDSDKLDRKLDKLLDEKLKVNKIKPLRLSEPDRKYNLTLKK